MSREESAMETIGSIGSDKETAAELAGGICHRLCSAGWMLFVAVSWLLYKGVGIWGINIPVAWGFAISSIAFGGSGSAMLWHFYFRDSTIAVPCGGARRSTVSTEAMTLLPACAGMLQSCRTLAARSFFSGCFRILTRWDFGHSSGARCGMFLPSAT